MSLLETIRAFNASNGYTKCLLIVHPEISVLRNTGDEIQNNNDLFLLDIGKHLSKQLLAVRPRNKSRMTQKLLQDALSDIEENTVLFSNISILFEPSLTLDALNLFRNIGRTTKLIVLWPGSFEDNILSYAVPKHAHYKTWQNPDVEILCPE